MTINWFEILLSLVWAVAFGLVAATAFIWRMERQRRADDAAFLRGLYRGRK